MDGTLIDSDRAVFHAMLRGMELLKIPMQENVGFEKAAQLSGGSLEDFMNLFAQESYRTPEILRRMYAVIPQVYNHSVFEKEVTAFNGVKGILLDLMTQGTLLGVVSNSTQRIVEQLCGYFFGDIFDFIYGDRGAHRVKPDPIGILIALRKLNVAPEDALYVGDTLIDLRTAEAAGVKMAGAVWSKAAATRELQESGLCPVFESPEDLLAHTRSN